MAAAELDGLPWRCSGRARHSSLPSPVKMAFVSLFSWSLGLHVSCCVLSSSRFSRSSLIRSSRSIRACSLQIPQLLSEPCWGHVHSPFFFTLVGSSSLGASHPSRRFSAPVGRFQVSQLGSLGPSALVLLLLLETEEASIKNPSSKRSVRAATVECLGWSSSSYS